MALLRGRLGPGVGRVDATGASDCTGAGAVSPLQVTAERHRSTLGSTIAPDKGPWWHLLPYESRRCFQSRTRQDHSTQSQASQVGIRPFRTRWVWIELDHGEFDQRPLALRSEAGRQENR